MESYLWLKNSKTYQSINGDDSEDITPHVKHLCQPVINGPADVAQILGAIQYWDVNEIPSNILLYFATHTISLDIINFNIEKSCSVFNLVAKIIPQFFMFSSIVYLRIFF